MYRGAELQISSFTRIKYSSALRGHHFPCYWNAQGQETTRVQCCELVAKLYLMFRARLTWTKQMDQNYQRTARD